MSQAEALYHLQVIDLQIIRNQKRLKEIAAALEDNVAVLAAQQQVETAQQTLKPLRTAVRDLELEIQTNSGKAKATEDRLYSGSVKNPKELQDMQNEIAAIKHRNDALEEKLLEVMMMVEEHEAVLAEHEVSLAEAKSESESQHEDLLGERDQLEAEVSTLLEKRKAALVPVTEDSLKMYNTLRKQKANQPMALLNGLSCGVCGIEQTMAIVQDVRRGGKFVPCLNCGRILVDL